MKTCLALCLCFCLLLPALALGAGHAPALRTDARWAGSVYAQSRYIYDTVTFTGTGLGQETVLSVKALEALALGPLGLTQRYSLMTRGSVFAVHEMTGVRLYDLLRTLGMAEDLPEDTRVTIVAKDGYKTPMLLRHLKADYGLYTSPQDEEPVQAGLPVLLSLASDGAPLVGPTGDEEVSARFDADRGYVEGADNAGGPARLTIGQKSAGDYNAPSNAKWVARVVVGDEAGYTRPQGEAAQREALTVTVHSGGEQTVTRWTPGQVEAFAQERAAHRVRGYQGDGRFYEGADLWQFLAVQAGLPGYEGQAALRFEDGDSLSLDLAYLRNASGSYADYTVDLEGATIPDAHPMLAYAADGEANAQGRLYAALPRRPGMLETPMLRAVAAIDVYVGERGTLHTGEAAQKVLQLTGEGLTQEAGYTVGELEADASLAFTQGSYRGAGLYALLRRAGLTVDAERVTVIGETEETIGLDELQALEAPLLLAYARDGEPLGEDGPLMLAGHDRTVTNVRALRVSAKAGQWHHDGGVYSEYLTQTLRITGPQAVEAELTLAQLQSGYTPLRMAFAASGGKNGYEGVALRELIQAHLKPGVKTPSAITVVAADGYRAAISVEDVMHGIESSYQPGAFREVLLAWAIDGAPLVPGEHSAGFTGENGYGPLRLVVENTISSWVKGVREIVIGEE